MPAPPQMPDDATLHLLNQIMAAMLREVFRDSYERGFDEPVPADIEARIETAHSLELKEWIPNLIDAENPEEIFTAPLEATLAGFTNDLLQRKFGIELDATSSLQELQEQLKAYLQTHPEQPGGANQ